MAAVVSLNGLTRSFPGAKRPALQALSLEVAAGEVLTLVGPSGCGKSTTLRIVAGLEAPDSGSVSLDGRNLNGVPPQDRDVAMVFQGFALYPHLSVRQILEFPLKMRGTPRSERAAAVERTASLLGLTGLLSRRPGELSGGEQQRVAMGRAIVRRPALFLFDEPLSNLDAALRTQLRADLARLLRDLGTTALYVTHDQVEAMTLSHRVAVLRAGKLEQCATPRRIYEAPASTFVATFFGSPPMNLLDVTRDGAQAQVGSTPLPVPPGAAGDLIAGIRPEHLSLVTPEQRDVAHRFDGVVSALEPLGAETHLTLDCGAHSLRLRVPGFLPGALGTSLSCTVLPKNIHWFRRSDGLAL